MPISWMETRPTPIVIVSGSADTDEVTTTFRAIEAGALTAVPRPWGLGHPQHEAAAKGLVQTVKLRSEVKVVRRWPRSRSGTTAHSSAPREAPRSPAVIEVVAIGASTGGPPVLQTILSGLSKDFPVPVLIVQHMAAGFVQGSVEWLSQTAGFPVHVATNGEYLLPGHAYVAPDGMHMTVGLGHRIALSRGAPDHRLCPSVSALFHSVGEVYGQRAVGLLAGNRSSHPRRPVFRGHCPDLPRPH